MLILGGTSDKIQVITGSAMAMSAHTSYVDITTAGVATPGRLNTAISTATTTDVSGSPTGTIVRNVKTINLANKDTALTNAITVQHTDGTTVSVLFSCNLGPQEQLQYVEGDGWCVFDIIGQRKIISPASSIITPKTMLSDQSNGGTTASEVTALTSALAIGTYTFHYTIRYQSSIVTTGIKLSCNFTGTASSFMYDALYVDVSATAATGAASQAAVATTAQVYGAYSARVGSTAGTMITASTDAANSDMMMIIDGMVVITVAGNLALWYASETAASTTLKAGSSLVLIKVA